MEPKTQEKVQQLQLLEQNIQSLILQKQQFQSQLLETENALKELEISKEAYKIIGQVMILSNKDKLKEELKSKKEITTIRIKSIEKQEELFKKKAKDIQEEVMKNLKTK